MCSACIVRKILNTLALMVVKRGTRKRIDFYSWHVLVDSLFFPWIFYYVLFFEKGIDLK